MNFNASYISHHPSSRHQRNEESLEEYETDVGCLIYGAYPGATEEYREELIIQYFIDEIRDQEIQRMLCLSKFGYCSEALDGVLKREAAYNMSKSNIRAVTIEENKDLPNQTIETMFFESLKN